MNVFVITGTGTGVGKTVATAAIAALAREQGQRVAVLKPAQTGVPDGGAGDLAEVTRLAGDVTVRELARFPDPLAPDTAARLSGRAAVRPDQIAGAVGALRTEHDLVLVEGAGGLLVRLDERGATFADVAWALSAPVVVVARSGLGTLNDTALTTEALSRRGIGCAGVIVGDWPADPDLAQCSNLAELPVVAGVELLGVLPDGVGASPRERFRELAAEALAPHLGGNLQPDRFAARHAV